MRAHAPQPALPRAIARLAALRAASPALQHGSYHQLGVQALWLAFLRDSPEQTVVVAVNADATPTTISVAVPPAFTSARDLLDPAGPVAIADGRLHLEVPPRWARVLELRR